MKKLVFVLLCPLLFLGAAQPYIERETAVVRVMDKAAGKVYTLSMPVGQQGEYEKLSIMVQSCKQTAPFMGDDFFMFVEISKQNEKIFSGWMSADAPGQNPLEDADYDLWLTGCE